MEDNANLRAVLIDWVDAVHLQIRLMAETFQVDVMYVHIFTLFLIFFYIFYRQMIAGMLKIHQFVVSQ